MATGKPKQRVMLCDNKLVLFSKNCYYQRAIAILPSEAAEAAEQELGDQFLKDDQSGMRLYLARLQDVVSMLAPSSPDFQPALLEALTSGRLYTQLSKYNTIGWV